jgi:hypothetical protein
MIECDWPGCNEQATSVFCMVMPDKWSRFSSDIVCIRCKSHPMRPFDWAGYNFMITEYGLEQWLKLFGLKVVRDIHDS